MKTFNQFLEQSKEKYYKIPGLDNNPPPSEVNRHLPSRPSWINDVSINDAKKKKNKKDFYKFDVKSN